MKQINSNDGTGYSKAKRPTPVRKSVFHLLRKQILSGELHYGERLIETEIAQKLKVSRTPIREAFRKLENEGLVEYSPGRGVKVSKVSPEDYLEFYAIRGVLEGLAARLAAGRIGPSQLQRLKELFAEMETAYKRSEFRSIVKLHTQFNELIYRAASSPQLYDIVTRFHEYTERSQLQSLNIPERFKEIQKEHKRIIEALEEGDSTKAEEAVRYHVEQARQAYSRSIQLREQFGAERPA